MRNSHGLQVKLKKPVPHIHHEKISWSPYEKLTMVFQPIIENVDLHTHHEKISWSHGKNLIVKSKKF